VVLVDDRSRSTDELAPDIPTVLAGRVRIIRGRARGPAAARNTGWRAVAHDDAPQWVAFLDDDVVPPAGWRAALAADLAAAGDTVAASQGWLRVPLPVDRRPTDWERNTAGLESAAWATADMAYRLTALQEVGGFDERFPRAYREDADLALRVSAAGWGLERGRRHVQHPVRPADRWVSLRVQKGNADDVLMRRMHGSDWRKRAQVPRGRRHRHLAVTACAAGALVAAAAGRPRLTLLAAAAWVIGTAELAAARIAPGPRTPEEIARMVLTSLALPPMATMWWLVGQWRHARAGRWDPRPAAVLFDRDGTLVRDVPYNGDPDRVELMPGAAEAVDLLRTAGVPVAVVSNQSGVARRLITTRQVAAVNARIDTLVGPIAAWQTCPHGVADGCACRKPAPGMVHAAARTLGVAAHDCVVIGDIGADIEAARAAGARSILVPTPLTRAEEVRAAPLVAPDLLTAVRDVLGVAV
jgi:histidinol-phosphate phosphatase family protein